MELRLRQGWLHKLEVCIGMIESHAPVNEVEHHDRDFYGSAVWQRVSLEVDLATLVVYSEDVCFGHVQLSSSPTETLLRLPPSCKC